jgi:hypothetical protein
MAIDIDSYGAPLADFVGQEHKPIKPNQSGGRVRVQHFTVALAAQADDDHIALAKLPKGARILGGRVMVDGDPGDCHFDLGIMGADLNGYYDTLSTPTADDDDFFGTFDPADAAATYVLADTAAKRFGYETQKEVYFVATIETAAVTVATTLRGYILYAVD